MSEILDRSLEMDGEISSEYTSVEMMRAMFEEVIVMAAHYICSCGGLASSKIENIFYDISPPRSGRRHTKGLQMSKKFMKVNQYEVLLLLDFLDRLTT